jgi:hypothetical protein
MKIERSFSTQIDKTTARARAAAFLMLAGYRPLPDSGDNLYFTRGSVSGAFANFNPTRWACTAYVNFVTNGADSTVNIVGIISSDPTEKRFAEELLTAEFKLLEDAVQKNEIKPYDINDLKKRITAHVYRIVGIFACFLFIIIFGIITGLYTSINFGISMLGATAIGAGVFLILSALFLVFWKRQKKQ